MKKCLVIMTILSLVSLVWAQPVTDGLIIHLDAHSITGLADGDAVTAWSDSATSDSVVGDVVQAVGKDAPLYILNSLNGNPALSFEGPDVLSSDLVTLPNVNNGLTVFIVATGDKSGDTAERVMQFGQQINNAGHMLGVDYSTDTAQDNGGSGARFNNGKSLVKTNNPLDINYHIAILQLGQGENYGSLKYFVDDMVQEVFDNNANPSNIIDFMASGNQLTIGDGLSSSGTLYGTDQYTGDIAEILIYNSQLTLAQMEEMLDYLDYKYYRAMALNPTPADNDSGQHGVSNNGSVDVTLSWDTGSDFADSESPNPDITKHYLYIMKDEPNFIDVTPIEVPAAASGIFEVSKTVSLEFDSVYYWRVDESVNDSSTSDSATITGPVWSFQTLKSLPVVVTQPVNTLTYDSQSDLFNPSEPVLTCTFTSLSPNPTVKWVNVTDPLNPVTVSQEAPVYDSEEGIYTATLSFADVSSANEGSYLCEITNAAVIAGEDPVQSDAADLGVRRLKAHWKFEEFDSVNGVYPDETGNYPADPNTDPVAEQFVANSADPVELGNALDLSIEGDSAADSGVWAPSAFTGQITFSAWVNLTSTGVWQGVVSNRVTPGEGNVYMEIRPNGILQLNAPDFAEVQTANELPLDQWTHVAATAGPDGVYVYVNGKLEGQNTNPVSVSTIDAPVFVGCLNRVTDSLEMASPILGQIDDVRVYNYARSHEEIVDLYYEMLEIPVCMSSNPYDFNDDCIVNVDDFASFAMDWLNCNLYPATECDM